MRMTHFKNANVDVSQLAVGTWGLDSLRWNGAMSEEEAIAAIRAMIQGGVNLIDTAQFGTDCRQSNPGPEPV